MATATPDNPVLLQMIPIAGPAIEPFVFDSLKTSRFGRSKTSDFYLPHESVSRSHAELMKSADANTGWMLTDLDSRHGTYINAIRLETGEATPISLLDMLSVGPWTFQLTINATTDDDDDSQQPDGFELPLSRLQRTDSTDQYATNATIFLRLCDDQTLNRELSWNEFASRYTPVISGFARNAGLASHEVDDVVQDVLLGFFHVSSRFVYDPSKGRFRGYLKRATLNAIRSKFRRPRPLAGMSTTVFDLNAAESNQAWNQEWMKSILSRAFAEAEPRFEDQTWKAFELFGTKGVPCEEVALQLDMNGDAVRKAKSRVAQEIRQIIIRIQNTEG